MAESSLLPLGQSGLVIGDLGLLAYRDLAPDAGVLADAALVVQAVSEDYRVTGLPDAGRSRLAFTYSTAALEGLYEWDSGRAGTPPGLILPWRTPGIVIGDLNARLYVGEGAASGVALTLAPLPDGGGYVIAGWPVEALGRRWVLVYEKDGSVATREWRESSSVSALTKAAIETFVLDNFTTAPVTLRGFGYDPQNPGGGFPAGGPFVELTVEGVGATQVTAPSAAEEGDELVAQQWGAYGRTYEPTGRGNQVSFDLAMELGALLKTREIGGVRFGAPQVPRALGTAPGAGGVWEQCEVTVRGQRLARAA